MGDAAITIRIATSSSPNHDRGVSHPSPLPLDIFKELAPRGSRYFARSSSSLAKRVVDVVAFGALPTSSPPFERETASAQESCASSPAGEDVSDRIFPAASPVQEQAPTKRMWKGRG